MSETLCARCFQVGRVVPVSLCETYQKEFNGFNQLKAELSAAKAEIERLKKELGQAKSHGCQFYEHPTTGFITDRMGNFYKRSGQ